MKKDKRRRPDLRAADAPSSARDVGYKKPPEGNRFKPGQSGNPSGRPKGARNKSKKPDDRSLRKLVLDEANRKIEVREGDKTKSYSVEQAVLRSLGVNAARGQIQSQKLFLEIVAKARQDELRELRNSFEVVCDYKFSWEDRIAHARQHNLPIPNPIPHPDDIDIDPRSGEVSFRGPVTQKERDFLDFLLEREIVWQEVVDTLEVESESDEQSQAELERELHGARKTLGDIQDTINAIRGDPDPIDEILDARREFKKLAAELHDDSKKRAE